MNINCFAKISAQTKKWWQMIADCEEVVVKQIENNQQQIKQKESPMILTLNPGENPVIKAAEMAKASPVEIEELLSFLGRHPSDNFNFEENIRSGVNEKNLSQQEHRELSAVEKALINFRKESDSVYHIKARHQYPVLSLEPLSWKRSDGFPVLVPFNLNNPVFSGELLIHDDRDLKITGIDNIIPNIAREKYINEWVSPKKKDINPGKYKFATYFSGLIPISLIPVIQKAKPLFDNIFIIAEANDYHISMLPTPKPSPVNNDPLVVGHYDDVLYLIAAFDLTPPEKAFVERASVGGFTKLERSNDCIMLHQLAGYLKN